MDFAETVEHQALRKTVAEIAGRFGGAYYAARARAREPCTELWQALGEAGFIGVNLPQEYGGGGGGLTELAMVCEETAAQGCPLTLLLVSSGVSAEVIGRYGGPDQKRRWLPGIAAGTSKIVFAITEPDAGSNTHMLSTTASRRGRPGRGRPGHPDARRQRREYRIRTDPALGRRPPAADRTGQPGHGAQLRGPAQSRTAPLLLNGVVLNGTESL